MPLLTVIITILCVLSIVPIEAVAQSAGASDISGFDEVDSTVTNYDTFYHSESYCISMYTGGGTFEFQNWVIIDIDCYVRFQSSDANNDDRFIFTFRDSEDSGNKVEIDIWSTSTTATKVSVKDSYNGDSQTESKEVTADTFGTWGHVEIIVSKTSTRTDGVVKCISVSIESVDAIESMELFTSEMSGSSRARKWNDVEIQNPDATSAFIDDIKLDTHEGANYGLNWTWIVIGLILLATVVVWWKGIWPFNGKSHRAQRITIGRLGKY